MNFTPGEVNITCSDLDASLKFYREILGFDAQVDEYGFYHLSAGKFKFLLLPTAKTKTDPRPYGELPQMSMDLYVQDLKAAADYFSEHKVPFIKPYSDEEPFFVISDPDGIAWEVTV